MAIILPKSIFFHVPKTGGTWVTVVLKDIFKDRYQDYKPSPKHELNLRFEHITPKDSEDRIFKDRKSFGFVRNPIDWYTSFWKYRMKNNWDNNFVLDRECRSTNLEIFVRNCLDKYPEGFVSTLFKEFTEDLDFVGKQENLKNDLLRFLEQSGEDISTKDKEVIEKTGKINVSNDFDDEEYVYEMSKDVIKDILEVESWCFEEYYEDFDINSF